MASGRISFSVADMLTKAGGTTEFGTKFGNALKDKESQKPRVPELRPSSMPMCSIRVFLDHLKTSDSWDMHGDYYTSVGTTLHQVAQKWLPRQGAMVGDWLCPTCKKKLSRTTQKTCCGVPMQYEEIEVKYRGVTGHIDTVLQNKDGYLLCDYKTTSMEKVSKPIEKLVSSNYIMQILTYTYICEQLFKWKMRGASLLFVPRDKPDMFREVHWAWTPDLSVTMGAFVDSQIAAFAAVREAIVTKDVDVVVKARACRNRQHYQQEVRHFWYGGCPLASMCVERNEVNTICAHLEGEALKLK